jgi:hypothetical protein
MSWKILQIVSAVAVLMADVAHAEGVAVFGSGQNSCGKLVAAAGNIPPGVHYRSTNHEVGDIVNEYAQYQEWLMGFVSGFNAHQTSDANQDVQVKGIDLAGMDLWMRNWCNKHPTQSVYQAAVAFINEMLSNRK